MSGPVAAPAPPAWAAKILKLEALVAAHDPYARPPWIVEPLVIERTLGIIAGKGGAGKTWIMHEAADAVQRGVTRAGMQGEPGRALIIDAEMGDWLTVDRFAKVGYSTDITVFDAMGMDVLNTKHAQEIFDMVLAIQPTFIGIDSLRALAPTSSENDSDGMARVVQWFRDLCARVGAAGLMVHHAGWKEERTRGSSAIKDRADVVWYLTDEQDEDGRRKLTCRGADLKAPRWGRPPNDLWVRIKDEGGLEATGPALKDEPDDDTADKIREAIASKPLRSYDAIAQAAGRAKCTAKIRKLVDQMATKNGDGSYHLKPDAPAI